MKKLLPLLFVFFISSVVAQDGYNQSDAYYNRIKTETTKMDVDAANRLGIDISGNSEFTYSFLRRNETDSKLVVIYQLNEIQNANDIKYRGYGNLTVWFSLDYTLRKITGNKETMVAIWNNYFLQSATPNDIKRNFKYRVLQNDKANIHFQLSGKGDYWVIENRSK